ncbi:signal recognition particle-docking protein FtsY [Novosphingobium resinovorum]|uniref:signal recognition particle-docking protein FtsY n=1 Tax=Novosphingobium resinovorum TaxID=158500 RepID=UPI003D2D9848
MSTPDPQQNEGASSDWSDRLFGGFRQTSQRLAGPILPALEAASRLTPAQLDALEDALIMSDLGPRRRPASATGWPRNASSGTPTNAPSWKSSRARSPRSCAPVAKPLDIVAFPRPQVILVIGVNGSGKTTTYRQAGALVPGAGLFGHAGGGRHLPRPPRSASSRSGRIACRSPSSPAPKAATPPRSCSTASRPRTEQGIDALIVDTAGRLQNKRELMDELAKIRRVLGRLNPAAPHDVVLVLDATNGQNALFADRDIQGSGWRFRLIMTKLDGTARGGVLVAAGGAVRPADPCHLASARRSTTCAPSTPTCSRGSSRGFA